ncbi:MAG: 50S ribosomal protein L25/general stress protein Ctc [Rhodospirillales bacterium]|nr:50S ribosomal protein L25/general stress protein Ctc [Rhodospirillales bacterium]
MTEIIALAAERRDRAGKGAARATRRAGRIPAVIYGDGKEPILISLEPRSFSKVLHREGFFAKLLDITIDGETHRTLPRDVQLHPVSDAPLHADFMRVSAKTRITVGVPVHFINHEKAPGLKRGGILNIVRHDLELICTADNIPDAITVDLEGYDIGDSIHISAVTLPEGTRSAITDRDFTIASIAAPSAVREEAREAAAASAEAPAAVAAAAAAPAAAASGGEDKKEKK